MCKGPVTGSWKGAEENHCYNSPESKVESGMICARRYEQVPGLSGFGGYINDLGFTLRVALKGFKHWVIC